MASFEDKHLKIVLCCDVLPQSVFAVLLVVLGLHPKISAVSVASLKVSYTMYQKSALERTLTTYFELHCDI